MLLRAAIKLISSFRFILLLSMPAYATDFTIVTGQLETTAQSLSGNETGIIAKRENSGD